MKINRRMAEMLLKVSLLAWLVNSVHYVVDPGMFKMLIPLNVFNVVFPALILLGILFGEFED